MKVVIDTNVLLVSVSSKSPYHWIFKSIINGSVLLSVTYDILLEYHEKIEEHMGAEFAKLVMAALLNSPYVLESRRFFSFNLITKDEDDNKFSDCAIAANAYCIVTEDKDFDVLKQLTFPLIRVYKIAEYEDLLKSVSLI